MSTRRRKHKWEVMRFRKRDPDHNLIAAATHWIRHHGGRALIIGGTEIQSWPSDLSQTYRLGIRFTGRKPEKGLKKDVHATSA